MGISKSNLGVTIDSIKNFVLSKMPSNHNEIAGRDATDAHPISSISGLQTEIDKVDTISIAQKTVNTKGVKELLDSKVTFTGVIPSTSKNSVVTAFDTDIDLIDDIKNYNILNISLSLDSNTFKYTGKANTILTKNIIYNNTNTAMTDGSMFQLGFDLFSGADYSYGYAHFVLRGWFKTSKQLHIDALGLPISDSNYNKVSIDSILGVNIENVTIDPVEYINTSQGIEDTPVGHIMSVMGKTAPNHYLSCDGSVYNITDYPYLSQYIKDQFGSFNYFGGDGTTTFAVPDLRDDFLRGYHGDKTEKLSGEIGIRQDATQISTAFLTAMNGKIYAPTTTTNAYTPKQYDSISQYPNTRTAIFTPSTYETEPYSTYVGLVNTRPVNVAVLFCIKYEPTYFMSVQGLIEQTVLWEGNVGTSGTAQVSNTINLSDSIMNYDMLHMEFLAYHTATTHHPLFKMVPPEQILYIINRASNSINVSINWGFSNTDDYTDITHQSTVTSLYLHQAESYITKVTGIKYKTF